MKLTHDNEYYHYFLGNLEAVLPYIIVLKFNYFIPEASEVPVVPFQLNTVEVIPFCSTLPQFWIILYLYSLLRWILYL